MMTVPMVVIVLVAIQAWNIWALKCLRQLGAPAPHPGAGAGIPSHPMEGIS